MCQADISFLLYNLAPKHAEKLYHNAQNVEKTVISSQKESRDTQIWSELWGSRFSTDVRGSWIVHVEIQWFLGVVYEGGVLNCVHVGIMVRVFRKWIHSTILRPNQTHHSTTAIMRYKLCQLILKIFVLRWWIIFLNIHANVPDMPKSNHDFIEKDFKVQRFLVLCAIAISQCILWTHNVTFQCSVADKGEILGVQFDSVGIEPNRPNLPQNVRNCWQILSGYQSQKIIKFSKES